MPGKLTPVVGYRMPGAAITMPVVRTGTQTPEVTTGGTGGDADWIARSTASGVVRAYDFTDQASLGFHTGSGSYDPTYCSLSSNPLAEPVLDTTIKPSGSVASIRFDVQQYVWPDGQFTLRFSPDGGTRFGANSHFFVQWRQRFDENFMSIAVLDSGGGWQQGIKQVILDTVFGSGSHTDTHIVCGSSQQYRQEFVYMGGDGVNWGLVAYPVASQYANPDYEWQVGKDGGATCFRGGAAATYPGLLVPGCVQWVADEWLTFQIEVVLGPTGFYDFGAGSQLAFVNSEVRMWMAREGQASVKLLDWKPGVSGYFPIQADSTWPYFGMLYLLPYMTGKSMTQSHPVMKTWYGQIIVSTQHIADPTVYPTWRLNKTKDTYYTIANTAQMGGYTWKSPNASNTTGIVNAWQGYALGGTKWYIALAGGHATANDQEWQNPVLSLDFSADSPSWTVIDAGSDYSLAGMMGQHYYDGRPASRHTYYSTQFVSGQFTSNGHDQIVLPTCFAAWAIDLGGYTGGPDVEVFDLTTHTWAAANAYPDWPGTLYQQSGICTDPRSGVIYLEQQNQIWGRNPSSGAWGTALVGTSGDPRGGVDTTVDRPGLIDVTRNELVFAVTASGNTGGMTAGVLMLQRMNITTHAMTYTQLTGLPGGTNLSDAAFVHDLDNNRYLLLLTNTGSSQVLYAINPSSGVCTDTGVAVPSCLGAPLGRLAFIQSLHIVVGLQKFTDPIWFMPTVTG